MLDSKVRPVFFFTHVAWELPGLGDGIHIAPKGECEVTLRERGSVKDFIGCGIILTGLHKFVF